MELKDFSDLLFTKPQKKLVFLFACAILLFILVNFFSVELHSLPIIGPIIGILILLFGVYFFILAFRIIFDLLIKQPLNKMLHAKNIVTLILSYSGVILGILLLCSVAFMEIKNLELGYITYGSCSDNFSKENILLDKNSSTDYFYFTTITFFTVGYGDICPMGLAKVMAMLTSFIGNVFSIIVMAIVISSYVSRKNKG